MARNKNRSPEELEARLVDVAAALKALGDPDGAAGDQLVAERYELEGHLGHGGVWVPGLIEQAALGAKRAEHTKREAFIEAARAKLEDKTDEDLAADEAALHTKTQALMAERAEAEVRIGKETRQVQEKVDAILAERLRRVLSAAGEPGSLTQAIGG